MASAVQAEAKEPDLRSDHQPVEPNTDIAIDTSDDDIESFDSDTSTSIASSVFNYKYENGRRYHAYRAGEYLLPNDEKEQDRLDLLHHIFRMTLGGELYRAPLPSNPQRILDFGTGTGIWAIDIADEFPSSEVIGTDLSPIQPTWIPPNCKFYVDDVESEWPYQPGEEFDFIHGRGMGGSIANWDQLYERAYQHLKPGGWIEMQEYETDVHSDDNSLDNARLIKKFQRVGDEASAKFGKQFNVAGTHKQRLIDAGFVNVKDDVYKIPIGSWPKDPKMKKLGCYQLVQVLSSLEPFMMALYTRVMGYTVEETEVLIAGVRAEFKDPKNHLYSQFHFIHGQKPMET
ncbi:hypothetical protein D8B26_005584 [Coccidioides posadasii str. Silveira]|uniref:Methyltransferase n=2 Tax=Coccidioides posadasii TaxID=199306 RepID=E9D3Y1_COCPS|nr:methyltransferase [Coccidioides posadasii str. Silveira]KMM72414.1 methyltransferase [Coccidioides posadasii RMSCC 3488]QVM10932.1 hypothetical protein D8B26_005584 [Coccidioides posadasii str. Silveira]